MKNKQNFEISDYFQRIPVFPSVAMSADGRRLAYISSITGSPQIWVGEIEGKSGLLSYPKPLTSSKTEQPHIMATSLQWIGNDALVCLMDRHGDEMTFIEIINLRDGSRFQIPSVEGARDYLGFVSDDFKSIYFTSNRTHPEAQGLYSFDLKTKKVKCHYHDPKQTCEWSEGIHYKGEMLFSKTTGNHSNTLHALNLKTGRIRDLSNFEAVSISPIGIEADGRILVLSNYSRQFNGLAHFDPGDQSFEFIGRDQWDVEEAQLSADHKTLISTRNIAGKSAFELYAFPSMKPKPLEFSALGVIESVSGARSGNSACFSFVSSTSPRDFYLLDIKTPSVRRLTDNWTSRVPQKDLLAPKLIQYESNRKKIYSWLFLPKGAKRDGQRPVIIWPHGGPQFQERAAFRPIIQYLASRGFAIWAPNPTGSTGFGKDFTDAISGQWGTADLPDMENGIAWLKSSGWIDEKKIAIMGGSYGGYMTLRSITRFPKVFQAAVDIFGVSNLLTFVKSVPPDWRPFMDRMVGNAERDADRLREQSPVFELDKIKCPLLVIQGALDPRVVKAESDQVVETLRQQGRKVEYLVFPDEGHGFLKLENELKAYSAAAEFLQKHLRPKK